ncbi:MAG: ribonuclease III [Gammaproteobacteria bacterium]|nr:ribonuclease III [Gammaproteobacteria bacterium]
MNSSDISQKDSILLLESKFKHTFKNKKLAVEAITHKSISKNNYERLEFLGDSVIQLAATELLISKYQQINEGVLTRERQRIVSRKSLNKIAIHMKLDEVILAKKNTINLKNSLLLADVFESAIGAIFLDSNYNLCRKILYKLFSKEIISIKKIGEKDPKTKLQEYMQSKNYPLPLYTTKKISSPDHKPKFKISCKVQIFKKTFSIISSTVKSGEQQVADIILKELDG